jgi:hypothetical protein
MNPDTGFIPFKTRINVNVNPKNEKEFELMGGKDFTFIPYGHPYDETHPIVGGVSRDSVYYKNILRKTGYVEGSPQFPSPVIDGGLEFANLRDKITAEEGLVHINPELHTPTLDLFTGSLAVDSFKVNNDFPIFSFNRNVQGEYDNIGLAGNINGYFDMSGSYDEVSGLPIYDGNTTLFHISKGDYHVKGELGDHVGEMDLAGSLKDKLLVELQQRVYKIYSIVYIQIIVWIILIMIIEVIVILIYYCSVNYQSEK